MQEAQDGVNVIIWFASNLVKDAATGAARVEFGSRVTAHGSGTLVHSQTHGGVQP